MLDGLQTRVLDALSALAITRHRTPEEHCASAWWSSARAGHPRRVSAPCIHAIRESELNEDRKYASTLPAAGYVRVKFFMDPTYQKIIQQCCVYVDFPLATDGSLDFEAVRKQWGLSKCVVLRYKEGEGMRNFNPRSQYRLLPKEVRVMRGQDGCISIIEEPCEARDSARTTRIDWLDCFTNLREKLYDIHTSLLILCILLAIAIFAWPRLAWHMFIALVVSEIAFVYALPSITARCLGPPRTVSQSSRVQIIIF